MENKTGDERQKLEEKYLLYQILQQNLEQMKQQYNLLANQIVEIEATKEAIGTIEKGNKEKEVLIPVGSGSYVYGRVSDTKNVLFNVGAGVMLRKDISGVKVLIEKKKKEIEGLMQEVEKNMNEIAGSINEIARDIQKMSS